MTEATREALNRIDQILHEAGWDQVPQPKSSSPSPVDLARFRRAYENLLSHEQFDILQAILGEPLTVEQFAEKIGAAETRRRFREAVARLSDFGDSCGDIQ